MRPLLLGLLAVAAIFAAGASAQVDFEFQAEGQLVAFVAKGLVSQDRELPAAAVRLVKVVMHNGAVERSMPVPIRDMHWRDSLLKMKFKLYRGPKRVGIYTYEALPSENKLKKGEDYLKAIPIDKDATIQAMTANTKEQANILNLLNMSVEEAAEAAKNESKLDELLTKAGADEVAILQKGKLNSGPLVFLPVNTTK